MDMDRALSILGADVPAPVVAQKQVVQKVLTKKEKDAALNEIRILASVQHPNVISYKEAFFESKTDSLCIVMELADNGDLLQMIDKKKKQRLKFEESEIWNIFIQAVRGIKALHDFKIIHRDVKC